MKLYFREYGEGSPIIILHGLLGSSDNWLTQAKLLSPSFKVYTIDQRNHGLSPHSDTFDYESMVSDLAEFIDDHKILDPVLMGHSMGGKTVMNFALKHPDKLKKLIVVDISPRAYDLEHYSLVEGLVKLPLATLASRNDADAALAGDVPVGAVIVRDGAVIARAANRTVRNQDATGHAETLAIRAACEVLGRWRLDDCTLYVTLEPCAMCAGASVLARIQRVVFGAWDDKAGMVGSVGDVMRHPRLNHRPEVEAGVLQEECGAVLKDFFLSRRGL